MIKTPLSTVIEEVFDFLLLAKIKYHRQKSNEELDKKQSLGTFAEQLVADIPEDVLNNLPADSAQQHDHYIYGTPKREQ